MRDVVITGAVRTPIGSYQGALSHLSAVELGSLVVKALLARSGVSAGQVDEVIMGQVLTAGAGQNPARQTALKSGLPCTVSAITINDVCGSGLKALHLATQAIQCGEADVVIAGGQENMSRAPQLLLEGSAAGGLDNGQVVESLVHDGLWDAFNDYHIGVTAENLAREFGISRQEQDNWALASYQKALSAIHGGRFRDEIVPVSSAPGSTMPLVESDEQPLRQSSAELLAALSPAFDVRGSVTAGNASSINDGAAAVMMMSAECAQQSGVPVLARIKAFASVGVDPAFMGIAPVHATRRCLERAGWALEELDLIEANEAFAAQMISVSRHLEWDTRKVNVNGGALALGHPIGASGCRILVSLLHEMKKREARKGLATLCIGGGQGVALAVER